MNEKETSWPAILYAGFLLGILAYITWEAWREQQRRVTSLEYAHDSLAGRIQEAHNSLCETVLEMMTPEQKTRYTANGRLSDDGKETVN